MLGLLLALCAVFVPQPTEAPRIFLEIRVFDGIEEVTRSSRVTVHRAGDRTEPIAQFATGSARLETEVAPGIYDVQAIHEDAGRVLNIRWAERLVVMPYPDEDGRHLEVLNLKSGFGALQVRGKGLSSPPVVAVYPAGARDKEAGTRIVGRDYALFVLPVGKYDVQTRATDRSSWYSGIDVPPDRTRLWLLP